MNSINATLKERPALKEKIYCLTNKLMILTSKNDKILMNVVENYMNSFDLIFQSRKKNKNNRRKTKRIKQFRKE